MKATCAGVPGVVSPIHSPFYMPVCTMAVRAKDLYIFSPLWGESARCHMLHLSSAF